MTQRRELVAAVWLYAMLYATCRDRPLQGTEAQARGRKFAAAVAATSASGKKALLRFTDGDERWARVSNLRYKLRAPLTTGAPAHTGTPVAVVRLAGHARPQDPAVARPSARRQRAAFVCRPCKVELS